MGSKVERSLGFSSLHLGTHPDVFGVRLATGTWHAGPVGLWVLHTWLKTALWTGLDWTMYAPHWTPNVF